jgi:hypothetical protein
MLTKTWLGWDFEYDEMNELSVSQESTGDYL